MSFITMKLSSQHRALYCYFIMSVWIFLLVADVTSGLKHSSNEIAMRNFAKILKPDIKTRRIFKLCNPPDEISLGSEGQVPGANLSLEAVLVFIRHGDRGSLSHVRNVSNVNCAIDISGGDQEPVLRNLQLMLQNVTSPQFLGPFHNLPPFPVLGGECQLGQLTAVGVAQLLKTGVLLRQAYGDRLGVGNGSLGPEDILVYSTRYRRTVQSALAFLAGFLSSDDLPKVSMRESQSLAFCFNDCACPAADKLKRKFATDSAAHLKAHPAVMDLVQKASRLVLEIPPPTGKMDPLNLQDALLTYVCHAAPLPCVEENCVRMEQVTGLSAYTDWEARQRARSPPLRRSSLLRAYGLVRAVVSQLVRIVSERRPRLTLFSGHDRTLQYLSGALGLETSSPHYAARLVLEVYRGHESIPLPPRARDFYLRILGDGRDLTSHASFCRHGTGRLCPIEAIIRFLHDDYFSAFNETNFKDVCTGHT